MTPERRQDIERICQAALDRDPHSRIAFLAEACAGDDALRGEVESLLAQELSAGSFMEGHILYAASAGAVPGSGPAIGQSIGAFQVVSSLGTGGMGEVYRARDTKLGREVALKILLAQPAQEPDWLARFHREAKVLAALSHPNIAAIYGFEESGPVQALVLELVEGPTLAERIAQGPIPLDEALPIATQITQALEAAHEHGIIHRDLKPANIKLRPDGVVKVLDFGLAKAVEPSGEGAASLSPSPKITMTVPGIILGTAAYMSPEQARGRAVDKRSDLWAFGCVLFEMLTGQRTFGADDVADTITSVLSKEPDWSALPPNTPIAIRRLLRRTLTKDPRNRLADAAMARLEIEEAQTEQAVPQTLPARTHHAMRTSSLRWAVAATLAIALAIALTLVYLRAPAAAPEMRVDIATPATPDPFSFVISPDGRRIVFVASGDGGTTRLWVRSIYGDATSQPLAGTDGARFPFWSPHSGSIAFFASSELKRLDLDGGIPQTIAAAAVEGGGGGGSWGSNGVIVFAPLAAGHLVRVDASGGSTTPATDLDRPRQIHHRFPHFLPDGRRFLFWPGGSIEARGIYLGTLDSRMTRRLADADSAAAFVAPDWLLFVRQGALVAQRFELSTAALSGESVTIVNSVRIDTSVNGRAAFSASTGGTVTYRSGIGRRELVWFDRAGTVLGKRWKP